MNSNIEISYRIEKPVGEYFESTYYPYDTYKEALTDLLKSEDKDLKIDLWVNLVDNEGENLTDEDKILVMQVYPTIETIYKKENFAISEG